MDTVQFPGIQPVDSLAGGWKLALEGADLQPAGCGRCKSAFLAAAGHIGAPCPVCAQERLAPQPALLREEPPEKVIPFEVPPDRLAALLAPFVNGVWLRPEDFELDRLLSRVTPLYWPMWLVDCGLDGVWEAEVGYDYQVKSSQEAYRDGGWRTNEVIETRVRWEPRLGCVTRRYENVDSPALEGQAALLRDIGTYRIESAIPFEPGLLTIPGGTQQLPAILRVPDLQPENAWPLAQVEIHKEAAAECQQASGGQHIRNFHLRTDYHSLNWTQLLLPVFCTYYVDDEGQLHTVMIHGQTGRIAGARLASQRKGWRWAGLLAGAALGVLLLGVLLFALAFLFAPLSFIGPLLAGLAFLLALAALIPAIWPWHWNRQEGHKRF